MFDNMSELNRFHKEFESILQKKIRIQNLLNKARMDSGCILCDIGQNESNTPLELRYKNCRKDKKCLSVIKVYQQLMDIKTKEIELIDRYSFAIFDCYSSNNPKLRNDITNEITDWKTVFGDDFTKLTHNQKTSIVSIIEDDGGEFRFV